MSAKKRWKKIASLLQPQINRLHDTFEIRNFNLLPCTSKLLSFKMKQIHML